MTLNERILEVIREEGPIAANDILEHFDLSREQLYASLVTLDARGAARVVPMNSALGARQWEAA